MSCYVTSNGSSHKSMVMTHNFPSALTAMVYITPGCFVHPYDSSAQNVNLLSEDNSCFVIPF